MSGVIDSNILLYAVNSDDPSHTRATRFLHEAAASADQWYFTEGILYEFLRVATHPKVFVRPLAWADALAFLAPLLRAANVAVLTAADQHWELLEGVLRTLTHPSGNLFFDVRTVVLMREHGVRSIYTADSDFLQFAGINVVNPLN
jgi:toxin-antitoxin system PIN domain toxin